MCDNAKAVNSKGVNSKGVTLLTIAIVIQQLSLGFHATLGCAFSIEAIHGNTCSDWLMLMGKPLINSHIDEF